MLIQLIVFDLDFTLWNTGGVWCDCTTPPYAIKNGYVQDAQHRKLTLYPHVIELLTELKRLKYGLAVASRTEEPAWAYQLIVLFGIDVFFDYKEIFPSSKINHLTKIHKDSGIPFQHMLFFDDEMRNIHDAQSLGVRAIYVENGINPKLLFKQLKHVE